MSHAEQIEALKGLLERVKAAGGPDREIDADLAIALDLYPAGAMHMSAFPDPATFATGAYSSWIAPAWTRSVDQALALAEELFPRTWHEILTEAKSILSRRHAWHMCFARPGQRQELPAAICAALLSAKLALLTQEESHG